MLSMRVKLLLFLLLNAVDFLATWWLLHEQTADFYEGNPVARWWLTHYGWLGLAAFKTAIVVLASLLVAVVSRRRPVVGQRLLLFGCVTVAAVVCHSGVLLLQGEEPPGAIPEAILAQGRRLEAELKMNLAYETLSRSLSAQLTAGRCSLLDAAAVLQWSEKGRDPAWRARLRTIYAIGSDRQCFAANALIRTVQVRLNPASASAVTSRLEAEFRAAFGSEPPDCYRQLLAPMRFTRSLDSPPT